VDKNDYADSKMISQMKIRSHLRNHLFIICVIISATNALALTPAAAQPSPEWIRVAVVQNDPEVNLEIHGRFTVRALHTGDEVHIGRRVRQVAVRGLPEGLAFGGDVVPFTGVRVEPADEATISLNGVRLRGTLEIVRQQDLTLLVVNHVGLEDYLRGVLSKEAPDYWPMEALKAIAIAARTYAFYQRLAKEQFDFDVTGTVQSQLYGGKSVEKDSTDRAVKATRGWILMSQGQLFPAFYHSTCGGRTEHARVMGPYDITPLQGGVLCDFCSSSPFYTWRRRLSKEDVSWALHKQGRGSVGTVDDLRVVSRTSSGRAEQIAIVGNRRTLTVTGYEFRALFGFERIRSPMVSILPLGGGFLLEGHGWGHGVGMCQWGASELARRGVSAPEILTFYYPQTQLVSINDLAGQPIRVIQGGS
jgi:stage II sporulation protein D